MQIAGPQSPDSDAVGCGLGICISNKVSDAAAALGTTLWKLLP